MANPLLIGEANPYGADPYFALYPSPERSAGHNLCVKLLGLSRLRYLDLFDRVNLCPSRWRAKEARENANYLLSSRPRFQAVLLGRKVAAAFRLEDSPPYSIHYFSEVLHSSWLVVLPHPSGLCREWNDPRNFLRARQLVQSVYPYDLF